MFLFDKELVICKKELIKRSCLVYKDRLTVEDVEVLEPLAVVDVRPHSFQLRSFSRAKSYLLACRSAQDKNQWVSAIQHLQQHNSSDWPIFPAPTMTFGRQKMSSKRSKGTCSHLSVDSTTSRHKQQFAVVISGGFFFLMWIRKRPT